MNNEREFTQIDIKPEDIIQMPPNPFLNVPEDSVIVDYPRPGWTIIKKDSDEYRKFEERVKAYRRRLKILLIAFTEFNLTKEGIELAEKRCGELEKIYPYYTINWDVEEACNYLNSGK